MLDVFFSMTHAAIPDHTTTRTFCRIFVGNRIRDEQKVLKLNIEELLDSPHPPF